MRGCFGVGDYRGRIAGYPIKKPPGLPVQAVKDQMAAPLSKPAPTTVYLVSPDSIVDAATSGMLNSNKVFSGPVVAVPSKMPALPGPWKLLLVTTATTGVTTQKYPSPRQPHPNAGAC